MADQSQFTTKTMLQRLRDRLIPMSSTQLIGLATLVIAFITLLILTGITLTTIFLGIVFFAPLLLVSSPVWVPVAFLLFVAFAGALSLIGFAVTVVAAVSWLYRYSRWYHPIGSNRVDYARTRLADTAGHVRDYYGGSYLKSRAQMTDAAPSA